MANDGTLNLNLRSQILKQNANGYNVWEVVTTPARLRGAETALLLCDEPTGDLDRKAGLAEP